MSRIDALKGFLADNPADSFSRYALALEYIKIDRFGNAVGEFESIVRNDPDYLATYYQLGKAYEHEDSTTEAEQTYRTGIEVASRAGDTHARDELQEALSLLLGT
jgi:Tfp pilus assembly protein PilF